MSTFLTRQFDLAHLAPRRLWQLTCKTLLVIYLGISLPLLGWLWWMPEDESSTTWLPMEKMVVINGEEGYASVEFCAYGIAWIEADLLGLPINLPQLKEGHMLNCHYTSRLQYWDKHADQEDTDYLFL